jgi:hypothetical protein
VLGGFASADEGDLGGACRLQRSGAEEILLAVALEGRAEPFGKFSDSHREMVAPVEAFLFDTETQRHREN